MIATLSALALTTLTPALPVGGDHCSATAKPSCSSSATLASATGGRDIVDTAVSAGNFNTLAAALKAGNLVDALKGDGPFTVFAPTDAAFAALPEGTLENLLEPENRGTLQAILTYHVVPGAVAAEDVVKLDNATTLNGQRVGIEVSEDGVRVAGATVTTTDIRCKNGIIHVIDRVILPNTQDIVGTAVAAGSFETLAAALKAAGLVEALKGEGPFTVFAPTDEAFAKLPEGTIASLLQPENRDELTSILKFHVIPGRVYSETAAKGAEVATLQGQKIRTRSENGKVFVNEAQVLSADIDTTNGVIHVIDSVILPK
jgi:uncharacterized surface protein with fasciclin (FAS1) repeats